MTVSVMICRRPSGANSQLPNLLSLRRRHIHSTFNTQHSLFQPSVYGGLQPRSYIDGKQADIIAKFAINTMSASVIH